MYISIFSITIVLLRIEQPAVPAYLGRIKLMFMIYDEGGRKEGKVYPIKKVY